MTALIVLNHPTHLAVIGSIARFFPKDWVPAGLAILALAATIGMFLGAIRVHGMKLGIPGVLFAALIFGQCGLSIDPKPLEFLRDFALILFMYAIGLDVGPGFLASLRAEGLRLNVLSVIVLVLGAVMTTLVARNLPSNSAPGLYAGSFTTTPGLAAAQDALRRPPIASEAAVARSGMAYSVTYPFGVIGPLLVIVAIRRLFGVKLEDERQALVALEEKRRPPLETADFQVTSVQYANRPLRNHPLLQEKGITLSRLLRENVVSVPTSETIVLVGDIYRAVGAGEHLAELVAALGRPTTADFGSATGDVQRMELVVTRTKVLRRHLRDLGLTHRTGVTIGRVSRGGIDLIPTASLRLAFGDRVTVVGPKAGLQLAEEELGNCPETLNRPQLVPIFLGIVLGVFVGSMPLAFPGLNLSLRIGLAGGPLIAAIILSQLGNIGSIVWYMPQAANQLLRDLGLAVFLACVGLQAGDHFIQRAATREGLALLLWGAAITMLPVFLVGCFARIALKMNFITLAGWVAGVMTSSAALLFADELAASDAPAAAYAAIAPLATLIPVIVAQVLAVAAR
jgi:putative transport protein